MVILVSDFQEIPVIAFCTHCKIYGYEIQFYFAQQDQTQNTERPQQKFFKMYVTCYRFVNIFTAGFFTQLGQIPFAENLLNDVISACSMLDTGTAIGLIGADMWKTHVHKITRTNMTAKSAGQQNFELIGDTPDHFFVWRQIYVWVSRCTLPGEIILFTFESRYP